MEITLNQFIKELSLKDKKTLSQKTLKMTEELGELSRKILPYDSASGTNHRFVDKESILEEIVDIHLCNVSILHSLDISEEQFNEMLKEKSGKWSELQSKEEKSEFPLPFEIHVTIDGSDIDIDQYKEDCKEIGVKPIVLDLEINNGSTIKDVMTSSDIFGDNRSAFDECESICNDLSNMGYNVIRKKIETVPWHPAVPQKDDPSGNKLPNGCYFESHIGVVVTPEEKRGLSYVVDEILSQRHIIRLNGIIKLSQNFFKKSKNGEKFVNMLTYRSYVGGSETFNKELESIKKLLKDNNYHFEKVISEYSIYDTNISHDSKWLFGN